MYYDLFQQGPDVFMPFLIKSAIITVIAYGAFPLIFAVARQSPITTKKYRGLCFGINVIAVIGFMLLNGGLFNGGPYMLWTWLFSMLGIKIIGERGLLKTADTQGPSTIRFTCDVCGFQDTVSHYGCPKCRGDIVDPSDLEPIPEENKEVAEPGND